jgi:uncharacterized membrane protein
MGVSRVQRAGDAERNRFPLWVWPTASSVSALIAASLLVRIEPETEGGFALLWPGDAGAASTMFQVLATATMASLTLTFSVTVVTLQLASQQFSPRLLREFTHDRVTKLALAVLTATFVYALTSLTAMNSEGELTEIVSIVGLILGLLSVAVIVGFVAHVARMIRVDTMMLTVHDETDRTIDRFHPPADKVPDVTVDQLGLVEARGVCVAAGHSGFVQRTNIKRLVEHATNADAIVRLEVRAGDHVLQGTPLVTVWSTSDDSSNEPSASQAESYRACVTIGYERTLDQDTSYGFRQLEDIAVKAMSPSINDPATAAHAVGHMGQLLIRLTACRLGPTVHLDDDGSPRAIVPDRDLRYYLDLCCDQLSRFASREPTVLVAMLRMLRDLGLSCHDDTQRAEVRRAADLVVASAEGPACTTASNETLADMRRRVELALAGDHRAAYEDRAGETRSL